MKNNGELEHIKNISWSIDGYYFKKTSRKNIRRFNGKIKLI